MYKFNIEAMASVHSAFSLQVKVCIHLHFLKQILLKRSSHYWTIIVKVLTSANPTTSQAQVGSSPITFASKDGETLPLLTEARMALANEALFKQDTAKALRLYSRVKTPHAAWNQSQVRGIPNISWFLQRRHFRLSQSLVSILCL